MQRRSFLGTLFASLASAVSPAWSAPAKVADVAVEPEDADFDAGFWGQDALRLPVQQREKKLAAFLGGPGTRRNRKGDWSKKINWVSI
jgi:hypothetical protein